MRAFGVGSDVWIGSGVIALPTLGPLGPWCDLCDRLRVFKVTD